MTRRIMDDNDDIVYCNWCVRQFQEDEKSVCDIGWHYPKETPEESKERQDRGEQREGCMYFVHRFARLR